MSESVAERGVLSEAGQPALYYRWAPAQEPRGVVLVLHGFGEHSGRYEHVLEHLAQAGFSGLAIDYRGWGRAEGKRGGLRRFEEYVQDALRGLALARRKRASDEPIFLLGHSQGGLLAARTAMEEGTGLAGLVLSSPGLGIGMPVPAHKLLIAKLASRFVPDLTLPSDIPTDWLTQDAEWVAATEADPLMVHRGTARWLMETFRTQALVLANASTVHLPTLILVAGDERLVSTEAARRYYELLVASDRTWIEYPDLRHELFNEVGRRVVLEDVAGWLAARSEGGAAGPMALAASSLRRSSP